ncbi:polyphenol oxidase family protein [Arthrobacter sp. JSM 101049]|uniref:polyphenol oxidase family protein n=1 Tax=Arthrobacter sp. JSM 101049 TaxID=929097 RepID=UPI0035637396
MLRFDFDGTTAAHLAFTSATEGNLALHVGDRADAVLERRRCLEASLGLDAGALQFMNQTHSIRVHRVPGTTEAGQPAETAAPAAADTGPGWGPDADAMVCADGSVPLAVMVADCLPVVFAASTHNGGLATAVAHAGRKGLLGGILQQTIQALRHCGADDIHAWIGPAVCGACYEVPAAMASEADAELPGVAATTSWGTPSLDLPGAAARQLAGLGVQVTSTGICTLEDPRYFSYRRDPRTGRLAGIIWPAGSGTAA